jgi:hypothetical protein
MADIESRKVDTVVVYKVDRLTRSSADFAKMVEAFDERGMSFDLLSGNDNSLITALQVSIKYSAISGISSGFHEYMFSDFSILRIRAWKNTCASKHGRMPRCHAWKNTFLHSCQGILKLSS